MKTNRKKLLNALWSDRPLRQKLAIGVWLSVLPISLLTLLIALQQARREVLNKLSEQLIKDATEVNTWLSEWQRMHTHSMRLAAHFPGIQELEEGTTKMLLKYFEKAHPEYSFAITKRDGTTQFTSGTLLSPLLRNSRDLIQNNTNTIAKALTGIPSSAPIAPPLLDSDMHSDQRAYL